MLVEPGDKAGVRCGPARDLVGFQLVHHFGSTAVRHAKSALEVKHEGGRASHRRPDWRLFSELAGHRPRSRTAPGNATLARFAPGAVMPELEDADRQCLSDGLGIGSVGGASAVD